MATIGEIATRIAHEVQNPLNFINNFSEINDEMMIELGTMVTHSEIALEANELMEQLTGNSKAVHQHGKRVAAIVSELLEKTWKVEDSTR